MSEDKKQNKKTDKAKHHLRHLWSASLIVLVVAIVCCFNWQKCLWNVGSIDEQLAAIEAARSIPDGENAAVYYTRFLTDPNHTSILDDLASYTPSAYSAPWLDSEHPQLAAKIKTLRTFIQTLLDISEMQQARFPVYPSPGSDSFQVLKNVRKVVYILSCAAANDLAEGRIDAAHSKYRCQLKLARHLQQQPAWYYNGPGIAIEALAHGNIKMAVMQDDVTPEQLSLLETTLKIPQNNRSEDDEIADKVNNLIERKEKSQLPLTIPLKVWWRALRTQKQDEKRLHQIRLRLLSSRQSTRILIALRRHKEETGTWPETIEQIEPKLPEQMLIDPQNNGPFVYKHDGDDFVFYSKGPNNIDEGGSQSGSADDWPNLAAENENNPGRRTIVATTHVKNRFWEPAGPKIIEENGLFERLC